MYILTAKAYTCFPIKLETLPSDKQTPTTNLSFILNNMAARTIKDQFTTNTKIHNDRAASPTMASSDGAIGGPHAQPSGRGGAWQPVETKIEGE